MRFTIVIPVAAACGTLFGCDTGADDVAVDNKFTDEELDAIK